MDTKTLIAEAKARFIHNSAKHYLAEKYNAKLIVADQGGLWKADQQTITFLSSFLNTELSWIKSMRNFSPDGLSQLTMSSRQNISEFR